MAHVHASFKMDVPPEQAQAMFVRDIVPDLHRDGRFTAYAAEPGELRLSDVNPAHEPGYGAGRRGMLGLDDIADPDQYEVHDREASEPALADSMRRGSEMVDVDLDKHHRHSLGMLMSHRLKVTFAPDGEGTVVRIKGSAFHEVAAGLEGLGAPNRWPEIADAPHD